MRAGRPAAEVAMERRSGARRGCRQCCRMARAASMMPWPEVLLLAACLAPSAARPSLQVVARARLGTLLQVLLRRALHWVEELEGRGEEMPAQHRHCPLALLPGLQPA
jgi:hypothetical protein